MFQAVGYDMSYRREAFRSDWDGIAALRDLKIAFEQAQKAVLTAGDGKWMVLNRNHELRDSDKSVDLMVIVPAGSDQRKQLLAAIEHFEAIMGIRLGQPVNTSLRTIEGDEPSCITCGKKAEWVRLTQFSGEHHFCDKHARQEPDFDESESFSNPTWARLDPLKIY